MENQDFQKELRNQINEWDADIARLMARADETRPEVRARYLADIGRLKSQKKKVEARLKDLENSQEDMSGGLDITREKQVASVINPLERFR